MRNNVKRVVAAVCGLVTVLGPAVAVAAVPCPTYFQVTSGATGGEFVGGLLFSESERDLSRTYGEKSITTATLSAETEVKYPVGSVSGGGTATTTTEKSDFTTVTGSYNVGVYKMNDGSTWLVNCDNRTQIGQDA
jgi:hypothetical protein